MVVGGGGAGDGVGGWGGLVAGASPENSFCMTSCSPIQLCSITYIFLSPLPPSLPLSLSHLCIVFQPGPHSLQCSAMYQASSSPQGSPKMMIASQL